MKYRNPAWHLDYTPKLFYGQGNEKERVARTESTLAGAWLTRRISKKLRIAAAPYFVLWQPSAMSISNPTC